MREMQVALRVIAKDLGSREIRKSIAEVTRDTQQSARAQQQAATATAQVQRRATDQTRRATTTLAQQQARSAKQTSSTILQDSQRLHQARERLGVRSERSIQREIMRTAIAYKRLEDSGRLSGQELARAADAAQAKIRSLNREMQQTNATAASGGAGGGLGKWRAAIGGGLLAGAAAATRPLSSVMSYDRQIALISNTAYAGENAEGRQTGQKTIQDVVSRAVQYGGGKREEAADALSALLGSSGLTRDESYSVLPHIQKMGLAAGRQPNEIVPLIGALNANGIGAAQIPDALGKMLHAGETGGYGIENMMSSLPALLAAQRDSYGITGMKGLESALANMQGVTAATNMPQESATSLMQLLNTLKMPGVSEVVGKKLSIDGKAVDLNGSISKGVMQGVDPMETFAALIEQSMSSNKSYKQLKGRLEKGGSKEDQEQMATLLESTVLRDVGIGRKPLLAMAGYMQKRDEIKDLRSDYAGRGIASLNESAAVMLNTASEKTNLTGQAIADARQNALDPLSNAIGDAASKLSEYATVYPGLTSALVGAGDAIKVMTAAALAFGGIKMLTGGGAGGFAAGGAAGASSVASKAGAGTSKLLGWLRNAGPAVPLAVGAYQAAHVAGSDLTSQEKAASYTRIGSGTAGSMGGAWAGGAAGAALGSVVPVVGTAVGGVLGSLAGGLGGGFLGDWAGQKLGNSLFNGPTEPRPEMSRASSISTSGYDPAALQAAMIAARNEPQKLEVTVRVEGGEIVAAVNEANARDARRN